jgi:hypothetical protein
MRKLFDQRGFGVVGSSSRRTTTQQPPLPPRLEIQAWDNELQEPEPEPEQSEPAEFQTRLERSQVCRYQLVSPPCSLEQQDGFL